MLASGVWWGHGGDTQVENHCVKGKELGHLGAAPKNKV